MDSFFSIFKKSSKRKLELLKYQIESDDDDISKFITKFRSLCRDAEIIDLEEQKKYFIQSLPTNFISPFKEIQVHDNSMNELIKNFDGFVTDYQKMIRNNSCVALKHGKTFIKFLNKNLNA